jgi:hypothetical protein
LRLKIKIK